MKNINVLVVDNELLIAHRIKMMLKNLYNHVRIAAGYDDALVLLHSHDIVLIDISLGGKKSGLDLADYINEKIHIPFIFLTSHTDKSTREKVLHLKPAAYLAKPVNKATLLTTIDIAIQNRRSNNFKITSGRRTYHIDLNLLLYAEAEHIYVNLFFLSGEKLLLRLSLGRLLELLPQDSLQRINRSQAVNPSKITQSGIHCLYIDKMEFKISPSYREEGRIEET